LSSEAAASLDQRELNKEFVYDYRFRKQQRKPEETGIHETVKTQRLEKFANINSMQPEELFDQVKDWANISNTNINGGSFTEKEKYGQLKKDSDVKGRQRKSKNLGDFAASLQNTEEDLSEREEEDIYAHYME
jgi:hypothetical protein